MFFITLPQRRIVHRRRALANIYIVSPVFLYKSVAPGSQPIISIADRFFFVIVLMISLRRPKLHPQNDSQRYGFIKYMLCVNLRDNSKGAVFLFIIFIIHSRRVLIPSVIK